MMQTRAEFQRRHVLLQVDVELDVPEANPGCANCGGTSARDCLSCWGRDS